jgi:predicted O-methyltransferase YrrM
MIVRQQKQIDKTLTGLFDDSKHDYLKVMKGVVKSIIWPIQPIDLKDAYLSISREQGEGLKLLIRENNLKNIIEFGTSFGISTLYLAQGAIATEGSVITTELIESKAQKAIRNFKAAGVNDLIEVRVGDALDTLKNHKKPIDLLLLDGWKDLYLPLFRMLEPNFHDSTFIYVDNADMAETQVFLREIAKNKKYRLRYVFKSKSVIICQVKKNS